MIVVRDELRAVNERGNKKKQNALHEDTTATSHVAFRWPGRPLTITARQHLKKNSTANEEKNEHRGLRALRLHCIAISLFPNNGYRD